MALKWSASSTHRMTWKEAHAWCKNLREGGHDDWRLPTIEELLTIVDYSRSNPACALPDTVANDYWSATTFATFPSFAWNVSFDNGNVNFGYKFDGNYVRGVRSGSVDSSTIRPLDSSCPATGGREPHRFTVVVEWYRPGTGQCQRATRLRCETCTEEVSRGE